MTGTRLFALMVLGAAVSVAIRGAQHGSILPNAPPAVFPQLFPNPTGHNGYEEFVKAVDLLNASPVCQEFEDVYKPAPTLEIKRELLADPTARRVLAMTRSGLTKRIQTPRLAPELQTLTPELGAFRAVARLICAEMDVSFADGQTARAVDCLNDSLRFGRAVQVGTLMSGVVGLYIENIALRAFSNHLDQLTIADCDKLIRVANAHLKLSDPQIALVASERDMYLRSLRMYRTDAGALLDKLDPGPNASVSDHRDYAGVCQLVRANPESGAAIFDQAAQLAGSFFDQTLSQLRRPVWERAYPGLIERDSPAAKLIGSICPPTYSRMGDRFASEHVMVQILATHAAVLRYHRRHGRLPVNLEVLNPGSLAIDPFIGGSLVYQRLADEAYEVSSAGAYDPGDSNHAPTGERVPIAVPYPPTRKLQTVLSLESGRVLRAGCRRIPAISIAPEGDQGCSGDYRVRVLWPSCVCQFFPAAGKRQVDRGRSSFRIKAAPGAKSRWMPSPDLL